MDDSDGPDAGWIHRARERYERAVFGGDATALTRGARELDAVEAALALARGRLLHAEFLQTRQEDERELTNLERAAELSRELGDVRGEGEALFWVGTFHQVVRSDQSAALPALRRSLALATQVGDDLTLSYVLRHIAFADRAAGRMESAGAGLEESLRLRRKIGFTPGVAAAVLALAYFTAENGSLDQARTLLGEARSIAEGCGAAGVLAWVDQAEQDLATRLR